MDKLSPSVRLFVAIVGADGKEIYYQLAEETPAPAVLKAWGLTRDDPKKGKTVYHVCETKTGLECSCPDWIFRKQNSHAICKHAAALKSLGLIGKRGTHAVEIEPQGSVESELPF